MSVECCLVPARPGAHTLSFCGAAQFGGHGVDDGGRGGHGGRAGGGALCGGGGGANLQALGVTEELPTIRIVASNAKAKNSVQRFKYAGDDEFSQAVRYPTTSPPYGPLHGRTTSLRPMPHRSTACPAQRRRCGVVRLTL